MLNGFFRLEEEAEAAAGQAADDSGRDRVRNSAEGKRRECAKDDRANASENVGIRRDFEFSVSHSFLPLKFGAPDFCDRRAFFAYEAASI
jgi:hypothetical protein